MAKIQIPSECGNAPRRLFLKNMYIALANGDLDFITSTIPEEISWEMVGKKPVTGKKDCITALKGGKLWKVKELILETIITHGPEASISGKFTISDNSAFAFCAIYRFRSAGGMTIRSVKTFIIKE